MQTITASAPALAIRPQVNAPRLSPTVRWLMTAAAAASVALGGLTVLLNAVEASESAEYAASHAATAGARQAVEAR